MPEKFPPPWSNGVLGVESEVADHSGRMRSTIELSKEEVELNSVPRISTVCASFILNNADASISASHNLILLHSAFPIVDLNSAAEINFVSPISSTPKVFHSTFPITNLSPLNVQENDVSPGRAPIFSNYVFTARFLCHTMLLRLILYLQLAALPNFFPIYITNYQFKQCSGGTM